MRAQMLLVLGMLAVLKGTALAAGGKPLEGGVDPQRIQQIAQLLDVQPSAFGPKCDDRAGWQRLAATKAFSGAVKEAEKVLAKPMPEMTEELYLQFKKPGRRTKEYGRARSERYDRITTFTRAECIENKGRFIKPLEAVLNAICDEKTWIYNFHDGHLDDYNGKRISIDLGSADLAENLGECLWLLGDRLGAETRRRVLARLRERIFEPYHKAVAGTGLKQSWITAEMNWNPVCHAGVVAAALAVCPDRNERAFFLAAVEKFSRNFLNGFDGDGYCAEGMGYWNYGFGNYIQLCESVFQATRGKVDLYQLEGARDAALYPVRIALINKVIPAYADCSLDAKPGLLLMSYINRRYGFGLKDFVLADFTTSGPLISSLMYSCPNSATARPPVAGKEAYEIRSYFKHGVLNCRPAPGGPCRLAVSLKGGHNAEPHNHNDLGTFVVVVGKEPLILDPGAEVYTARTFSKDRYKSNLLNSFGHPVPVIAGQLQREGRDAQAIILTRTGTATTDTFAMDLRSAYAVKELQTLKRTFVYSRAGAGALTVTDDFAFSSPQTFSSALITYGQWKQVSTRELLISSGGEAVRVAIETGGMLFTIAAETIKEENHGKTQPTRIGINLANPQARGRVTFTIVPIATPTK